MQQKHHQNPYQALSFFPPGWKSLVLFLFFWDIGGTGGRDAAVLDVVAEA
jgi:hypothetical protein